VEKNFTYKSHREAYNRCGLNGTSYLIGLPAAIGVILLLKRELKDVGLLFPEQLNPHPFIRELIKHNIPVIFEERRTIEVKEF
jgi:saccharopine dehydrogenase-like NADP-dependent oxidoreductase